MIQNHRLCFSIVFILICYLSPIEVLALVNLESWEMPPVVTLMPEVENLRVNFIQTDESFINETESSEVQRQLLDIGIVAILPWTEKFLAGIIADWQRDRIKLERESQTYDLTVLSGRLAFGYLWNGNNMLMLQSGAGLYTDFNDVNIDDVGFTHLAFWVHSFNGDTVLGLIGVAVIENFEKEIVVPLLGGTYQPSKTIRIDGILPSFAKATWHFTSSMFAVFRFQTYSNVYNAKSSPPLEVLDIQWDLPLSTEGFDVRLTEANLSLGIGYHFTSQITAEVLAGLTTFRQLDIRLWESSSHYKEDIDSDSHLRFILGFKF